MEDNLVGLKIMFAGGNQWLAVSLPEDQAVKFVTDWTSGEMSMRGTKRIGGKMHDGSHWGVDVSQICAIHTFDISNVPGFNQGARSGGGQQQPTGPGFIRK